jgi:aquaporin Z
VAIYITFEDPLSGMSMNPARSFASAVPAQLWDTLWLYFTAPPVGMLLAAEVYVRWRGIQEVYCAKLHHQNQKRCIFRCNYGGMMRTEAKPATVTSPTT